MTSNTEITNPFGYKNSAMSGFSRGKTFIERNFDKVSDTSFSSTSTGQDAENVASAIGTNYYATPVFKEESPAEKYDLDCGITKTYDRETNLLSSANQNKKLIAKQKNSKYTSAYRLGDLRESARKAMLQKDSKQPDGNSPALSSSTGSCFSSNSGGQGTKKVQSSAEKNYFATPVFKEEKAIRKYALENGNTKKHDKEANLLSSVNQNKKLSAKSNNLTYTSAYRLGDIRENARKAMLQCDKDMKQSDGDNPALSTSTGCSGSFLSDNNTKENVKFANVRDGLTEFSKPLRLFNKSGKPLTDQMGRPLINVLGERLVLFDDRGRVISDSKGNQVFNSLGESAIYPTTNLYVPPSEEESVIPLLDVDKKHILFLYDNKGHPMTDSLGRPLLCASGNLMLGMRSKAKINISDFKHNKLKNMYSRAPLESFIRYVQIFDVNAKPLTDDCGRLLDDAKVICNKNGMPMCDDKARPIYFKYGSRISTSTTENRKVTNVPEIQKSEFEMLQVSTGSLVDQNCKKTTELETFRDNGIVKNIIFVSERCISDGGIKYVDKSDPPISSISSADITKPTSSLLDNDIETIFIPDEISKSYNDDETKKYNNNVSNEKVLIDPKEEDITTFPKENSKIQSCAVKQSINVSTVNENKNLFENETNFKVNSKTTHYETSPETIFLYDGTEKMENEGNSSVNVAHFEAIKEMETRSSRKLSNKIHSLNIIQLFKNTLLKSSLRGNQQYQYNEYGKPLKDIHGNLLYDKYGIPLTGAQGKRLSDEARQALRLKLRNVPKNKVNITAVEGTVPLSHYESHDQFGEPVYDKYGRPLYDLAGKLIYDRFGRPLTDAYGRPLVDAIGQPLMDCEGRVLTSACDSDSNLKLTDIFGRKIYDRRGRALFDLYGRPKYDIFTNAVYDCCGRPGTDANGKILFDFLNKPIQPYPEKPLYKNARGHLPRYIDTILAVPSMYRLLKYSQPLEDVFGGPLFDDFGRPLYNKIGKPLFDRYGRPLYDKNGTPLCDSYGRPLSEDIKQSDDDQTLSVVDCLKLLKVTEESSKWMVGKNKASKSTKNKNTVMKISYKKKHDKRRSGQYVYTLTRVTKFVCGRQALEILEAPLSPSTVAEMHRLPIDNKPLIMVVGHRQKHIVKQAANIEETLR